MSKKQVFNTPTHTCTCTHTYVPLGLTLMNIYYFPFIYTTYFTVVVVAAAVVVVVVLNISVECWRDGSVAKSPGCSSRGLGFDSQHTHHGSQSSVTPVSGKVTQLLQCLPHKQKDLSLSLRSHRAAGENLRRKIVPISAHVHCIHIWHTQ